eukprot:5789846-Amphidinium_carterae.1
MRASEVQRSVGPSVVVMAESEKRNKKAQRKAQQNQGGPKTANEEEVLMQALQVLATASADDIPDETLLVQEKATAGKPASASQSTVPCSRRERTTFFKCQLPSDAGMQMVSSGNVTLSFSLGWAV